MHLKYKLTFLIILVSSYGCSYWNGSELVFIQTPDSSVLPDGSRYSGETKNGLLSGQGRLIWPSGASYEGEFVDGQMFGIGNESTHWRIDNWG